MTEVDPTIQVLDDDVKAVLIASALRSLDETYGRLHMYWAVQRWMKAADEELRIWRRNQREKHEKRNRKGING